MKNIINMPRENEQIFTIQGAHANDLLDKVLSEINKREFTSWSAAWLADKTDIGIAKENLNLILRKLEKDGFITWSSTTIGDVEQTNKLWFFKNLDGIIHESNGGYTEATNREKRRNLLDRVEVWAVIIGGAGGAVALLYFVRKLCIFLWNYC